MTENREGGINPLNQENPELSPKVDIEEAREVLGDDVFGSEEVKTVFGAKLEGTQLPDITYTRAELEKAKELGEMLILQLDRDSDGKPLTMERMEELSRPIFKDKQLGRIIYPNEWLWRTWEKSYTTDTPRPGWKLVTKDVLPNSTSKNYIEQTQILRDYLQSLGALSDQELKDCSDAKLEEIQELIKSDVPAAEDKLENLQINQRHRTHLCEDLYDQLLMRLTRGKRLLENNYNWTITRSTDVLSQNRKGGFINFGNYYNNEGSGARIWPANTRVSNIGIRSVR